MAQQRPSGSYLLVIRVIDKITEWTGYLFALIIIPLILANLTRCFSATSWTIPRSGLST